MPGKSGVETIRELWAEFPGTRVVVMSGDTSGAALDGIGAPGTERLLALGKPFIVASVLTALGQATSGQSYEVSPRPRG